MLQVPQKLLPNEGSTLLEKWSFQQLSVPDFTYSWVHTLQAMLPSRAGSPGTGASDRAVLQRESTGLVGCCQAKVQQGKQCGRRDRPQDGATWMPPDYFLRLGEHSIFLWAEQQQPQTLFLRRENINILHQGKYLHIAI